MALLIFMKQPARAIAVKGDRKFLDTKVEQERGNFSWFQQLDSGPVFIQMTNIAYIEEVAEKELRRRKKEYENKMKLQQQQGQQSNFTIPNMLFPKGN